jgi:hypothetical protein
MLTGRCFAVIRAGLLCIYLIDKQSPPGDMAAGPCLLPTFPENRSEGLAGDC